MFAFVKVIFYFFPKVPFFVQKPKSAINFLKPFTERKKCAIISLCEVITLIIIKGLYK